MPTCSFCKKLIEEGFNCTCYASEIPYIPYDKVIDITPKPIIKNDVEMLQILVPVPKKEFQIDLTLWDRARIIGDNMSLLWKIFKFIYPILGSIIIIINWLQTFKKERTDVRK